MVDGLVIREYQRLRSETPLMSASTALAIARAHHEDYGWEEDHVSGEYMCWRKTVDGFDVMLKVSEESIYPMPGDGLGEYVDGHWGEQEFEPNESTPLNLPAGIFRYDDAGARESRFFFPAYMDDEYEFLRTLGGQSASVARDMLRTRIEARISDFFHAPLTYVHVEVTVSRNDVELGSDAIGSSFIAGNNYEADLFQMVEEHGMVDNAIEQAEAALASIVITDELRNEIRSALQGDSNDAEHDALVSVAAHFGVDWEGE